MKILSLEPDPSQATAIRQQLESARVDCVVTTVPALTALPGALDSAAPDLVLLGASLSDEARRAARELVRQRRALLPLVVLSPQADAGPVMDASDDRVFDTGLPGLPMALRCAVMNSRAHRQPTAEERGHGELVFVVDDNTDIRESIRIGLMSHGYRTLPLRDGAEAVAQYASRIKEVALVITDLDMPRLGGQALAKALRRLNPHVKFLFISGTGSDERLEEAADLVGAEFLPKPFRLKELLGKVESLIHPHHFASGSHGHTPSCT